MTEETNAKPRTVRCEVVVTPPGYGITHLRHVNAKLREIDELMDQYTDPELLDLKVGAKETGNWGPFMQVWAQKVIPFLEDNTVLIVPHIDIAGLIGCKVRDVLYLDHKVWESNLSVRKQTPERFAALYESAVAHGRLVATNEDMRSILGSL